MVKVHIGLDPGGAGAFGWCVLGDAPQIPLQFVASGVADHALGAVQRSLAILASTHTAVGAGIDAPLFWRRDGDREVDRQVRTSIISLGANSGTVNHVNSLRGACLVGGMTAAMLLRAWVPGICLSEAHPKAALWLLGIAKRGSPRSTIALSALGAQLSVLPPRTVSDHERDAALAALSAWAMVHRPSTWQDLSPLELNRVTPLDPPPQYWVPK